MARKTTDRPKRPGAAAPASPQPAAGHAREGGLQPWHLLLVGTVIAVATGVFAVRGTGTVNAVSPQV